MTIYARRIHSNICLLSLDTLAVDLSSDLSTVPYVNTLSVYHPFDDIAYEGIVKYCDKRERKEALLWCLHHTSGFKKNPQSVPVGTLV